jgi:hypothetical protein
MKNKYSGSLVIGILLAAISQAGMADRDDDDDEHGFWKRKDAAGAPGSALYKEECGGCHFAYPPGLLPARSWEKIMTTLDEHFGDNAEVESRTVTELTAYLATHAADPSRIRAFRNIDSLESSRVPIRITELRYFTHEHNEIPARMVKDNEDVRSLSNCIACHRMADKGSFNEHSVKIPNYGNWDD